VRLWESRFPQMGKRGGGLRDVFLRNARFMRFYHPLRVAQRLTRKPFAALCSGATIWLIALQRVDFLFGSQPADAELCH